MTCLNPSCVRLFVRGTVLAACLGAVGAVPAGANDLVPEASAVASTSVDAFGNVTRAWRAETYGIIWGQSKLVAVSVRSQTDGVDGSVTQTDPYTVELAYGPPALGQEAPLAAARLRGEIHSTTTDAFGNVTESWTTPTYDIILGQAKLSRVTTRAESRSVGGTTVATAPHAVHYEYDHDGSLVRATQERTHMAADGGSYGLHATVTDASGGTAEGWSTQEHGIVWGQAVVTRIATCSTAPGREEPTQSTIILGQAK